MIVFLVVILLFSNGFYNAQSDGDVITIVEDINFSANTIWYKDKLDLNQNFDLEFSIYLGEIDKRGDGGTILFSASDGAPIGGEGGIIGALNIPDSLVFEFDTYYNASRKDSLEQDVDTGLDSKGNNGHLGIVETNEMEDKHKSVLYSEDEVLGDGSFRDVFVQWDTSTQTMSFLVEGFEMMHHVVNIDSVFSGTTEINWGFSSANGQQKTDVKVETTKFPHQAFIEHSSNRQINDETKEYIFELTKTIGHDKGPFESLYIHTNDTLDASATVNGEPVKIVDNILLLDSFTDETLEVIISVNTPTTLLNELELTYKGDTIHKSSEWVKEELPPIISEPKPEVKPKPKPDPKPVPKPEPTPQPPTIEPPKPGVPDLDKPVLDKPVLDKPNVDKPIIEKPTIENPVIEKPEPPVVDDKLVSIIVPPIVVEKEQELPVYVLDEAQIDEVVLNEKSMIHFSAGEFGLFNGSKQVINIAISHFTKAPSVHPHDGYEFMGYSDSSGILISEDAMEFGNTYTAKYRESKVIDNFVGETVPWWSSIFISLLLILLRYILNKDIRNREEIHHDV